MVIMSYIAGGGDEGLEISFPSPYGFDLGFGCLGHMCKRVAIPGIEILRIEDF